MKKICLLAAAVSVFALNANASDWKMSHTSIRPYVGADYVYSHAKHGGYAKEAKKDYNSWIINVGAEIAKYTDLELFYQYAGERKTRLSSEPSDKIKSKFNAWGLDMYGRMPIMCSGFNALGSLGLANYDIKIKNDGQGKNKERIGYRAGLGFSYDFNPNVSFRVMGRYSYVGVKTLDHLMEVTAGLRYTF